MSRKRIVLPTEEDWKELQADIDNKVHTKATCIIGFGKLFSLNRNQVVLGLAHFARLKAKEAPTFWEKVKAFFTGGKK